MDTVTHALLPVIATGIFAKGVRWIGRRGIFAIGMAGALPDILTPHLSLEARMSSWSHGLPFWLAFTFAIIVIALTTKGRIAVKLALALSASYLLHLFCDAISGGVNFLYPFEDLILGDYWVPPIFWVPLDIACVLTCYFMFRVFPAIKARRHSVQATRNHPPLA